VRDLECDVEAGSDSNSDRTSGFDSSEMVDVDFVSVFDLDREFDLARDFDFQ
jgi:hypothetical protein